MEPKENYPGSSLGPVDYDKTLDEYWQSICPTNEDDPSGKAKKSQHPEEQIWRYTAKQKADEQGEKALVAQKLATKIQKEADLMEALSSASIRSASFWILVDLMPQKLNCLLFRF